MYKQAKLKKLSMRHIHKLCTLHTYRDNTLHAKTAGVLYPYDTLYMLQYLFRDPGGETQSARNQFFGKRNEAGLYITCLLQNQRSICHPLITLI